MYARMRLLGIGAVALALLAAVPARALEERIVLAPGGPAVHEARSQAPGARSGPGQASFDDWRADGAVLRRGFKGALEYALATDAYRAGTGTDLLLHFDGRPDAGAWNDEAGLWTARPGAGASIDSDLALFGSGAAAFRGAGSGLTLSPGPRALLARDSRFGDFSIEFWLYPANAENGEVVLMWQSLRKSGKDVLPQQLSCVITAGRLDWSFYGFFAPPETTKASYPSFPALTNLELAGRSPLVPRIWSHHLVRFDSSTGLLEYLVDGRPEAIAHVTSTGHEGGTVFTPAVGGGGDLFLGPEFSGLVDEFRLSRSFVGEPVQRPYGKDPALVVSPVVDLGFGHSRLVAIEAAMKVPGSSGIELSYRIAEEAAGWSLDRPGWIPLRADRPLPPGIFGRYVQVRAELFTDGGGTLTPSLSALTLRYEPDPPPPPPARVVAFPKDGAIELRWTRVPVADLGGYLVYYGENPGEYLGRVAVEGESPIDAGQALSITLSGLRNGQLYFFAVASYDAAVGATPAFRPSTRAGDFSDEVAARPSRTAP